MNQKKSTKKVAEGISNDDIPSTSKKSILKHLAKEEVEAGKKKAVRFVESTSSIKTLHSFFGKYLYDFFAWKRKKNSGDQDKTNTLVSRIESTEKREDMDVKIASHNKSGLGQHSQSSEKTQEVKSEEETFEALSEHTPPSLDATQSNLHIETEKYYNLFNFFSW
ncbi:uncharacterized protein LOC119662709 isoform X2 [Teleopsis dalmanni]|nr:uncharacterized protein LOC119662709 isoform X2 [Teleopsis dalmanni]